MNNLEQVPLTFGQDAGSSVRRFEKSWRGDFNTLRAYAEMLTPGAVIGETQTGSGQYLVAQTWDLVRGNGSTGTLTVTGDVVDGSGGGSGGAPDAASTPLKDVWSVSSSRIDKPLDCYCCDRGVGTGYANLAMIRAWQAEPDGELAADFQYKKPNGEIVELVDATLIVARKYAAGIKAVMRFYPVIRRSREYAKMPSSIFANLGEKNTPSGFPAGDGQNPSALSRLVSAFDWLKIEDNTRQLAAGGRWERSEAWMGLEKGSIDEDLYGAPGRRWNMPYNGQHNVGGAGGGG